MAITSLSSAGRALHDEDARHGALIMRAHRWACRRGHWRCVAGRALSGVTCHRQTVDQRIQCLDRRSLALSPILESSKQVATTSSLHALPLSCLLTSAEVGQQHLLLWAKRVVKFCKGSSEQVQEHM
jgi:hypothetical protein